MWDVRFERKAEKAIEAMHPQMRRRISDAIKILQVDPYGSTNVKRLTGSDRLRLRVGEWRVIFRLENDRLIIVVINIGPRSGVY